MCPFPSKPIGLCRELLSRRGGYGHALEKVGSEPARILSVFDSGTYETVDVSQWIAGQPADVLAVNFGKPAATFDAFPKRDVFITKGSARDGDRSTPPASENKSPARKAPGRASLCLNQWA